MRFRYMGVCCVYGLVGMEGVLCGTEGFNVLLELLSSKRVSDVGQVERESGGCGCGLHGCDGAEGLAALLQLQSELKPLEPGSVFMGPVIGGVTAIHEGLILRKLAGLAPNHEHNVDRAVLRGHGGDDVGDGGAGGREMGDRGAHGLVVGDTVPRI